MTNPDKTDLPCPFCHGTGKYPKTETPRCARCRGTGFIQDVRIDGGKTYCDCQLGKDLKRMDARRSDEEQWALSQPVNAGQPPPEAPRSTAGKLRELAETIQYKPEDFS